MPKSATTINPSKQRASADGDADSPRAPVAAVPTRTLFSIPVAAASMEDALTLCRESIAAGRQLVIGAVNAAKVVDMHRNPEFGAAVRSADVIFADGMAVVWASKLCRKPLPERVAGIDLFERLLEVAAQDGHGVYLLGSKQDVLDEMIARLRQRHPALRIAGSRNGYFDDAESGAIADAINASGADMLFLGMTSPKKENFLATQASRLPACVCHGVGGSFDVLAGKVRRAPRFWQRIGLEWAYRLVQEPRRLWRRYFVTNTIFIGMTLREMFRRRPPDA